MLNINNPSIMTCVYTLVHSNLGYLFDKFSSTNVINAAYQTLLQLQFYARHLLYTEMD